ncbi:MAG: GNAT family N-acetyltransferase, partial [Bacteroidia bacterium]|nr:GNAT family N-acetyltransferase [Bacteroidia bacterium]
MEIKDWDKVSRIYQIGIDTGIATFEKEIPTWNTWDTAHIKSCRLIAENDHKIVGWAALSPVSGRCVYGGVAEVSVYVDTSYNNKGIGTRLLQELIKKSEKNGIWTLQSGIFPENKASIQLHKKLGFREIGFREKIGKKDGVWYDNVILEKRSKT